MVSMARSYFHPSSLWNWTEEIRTQRNKDPGKIHRKNKQMCEMTISYQWDLGSGKSF
jgi:hypothetical protein